MKYKFYTLDNEFIEEIDRFSPNFTGIVIDQYKKMWYLNGKCHRLNGPAYEYPDGTKEWCIDGKTHRLDGPAFIDASGHKQWWVNGRKVTEKQCKLLHDIMKLKKLI